MLPRNVLQRSRCEAVCAICDARSLRHVCCSCFVSVARPLSSIHTTIACGGSHDSSTQHPFACKNSDFTSEIPLGLKLTTHMGAFMISDSPRACRDGGWQRCKAKPRVCPAPLPLRLPCIRRPYPHFDAAQETVSGCPAQYAESFYLRLTDKTLVNLEGDHEKYKTVILL